MNTIDNYHPFCNLDFTSYGIKNGPTLALPRGRESHQESGELKVVMCRKRQPHKYNFPFIQNR